MKGKGKMSDSRIFNFGGKPYVYMNYTNEMGKNERVFQSLTGPKYSIVDKSLFSTGTGEVRARYFNNNKYKDFCYNYIRNQKTNIYEQVGIQHPNLFIDRSGNIFRNIERFPNGTISEVENYLKVNAENLPRKVSLQMGKICEFAKKILKR